MKTFVVTVGGEKFRVRSTTRAEAVKKAIMKYEALAANQHAEVEQGPLRLSVEVIQESAVEQITGPVAGHLFEGDRAEPAARHR